MAKSSPDLQHPIQRNSGPVLYMVSHANAIDHVAIHKVFQRPREVLRRNSEHRRAQTSQIVKCDDFLSLLCEALAHAVDKVNFCSNCKHRSCGGVFDDLNQALSGAELIRLLADFSAALR